MERASAAGEGSDKRAPRFPTLPRRVEPPGEADLPAFVAREIVSDASLEDRWKVEIARGLIRRGPQGLDRTAPLFALEVFGVAARGGMPSEEFLRFALAGMLANPDPPQFGSTAAALAFADAYFQFAAAEEPPHRAPFFLAALSCDALVAADPPAFFEKALRAPGLSNEDRLEICSAVTARSISIRFGEGGKSGAPESGGMALPLGRRGEEVLVTFDEESVLVAFPDEVVRLAFDALVSLGGDLAALARERLRGDPKRWGWERNAIDLLSLLERRRDVPAPGAEAILAEAAKSETASIRLQAYELAVRLRGPEAARPALSDRARKTREWAEAVLRGETPGSGSSQRGPSLFDP